MIVPVNRRRWRSAAPGYRRRRIRAHYRRVVIRIVPHRRGRSDRFHAADPSIVADGHVGRLKNVVL